MQLQEIEGLGKGTVQRLHKGGIRSVEELALIDTRRKRIPGMKRERLVELRRQAQKTIFSTAASRFRAIADSAKKEAVDSAHTLERLARQATENALAAAKEAESYASEALRHAELAAADLADFAASQAQRAQLAAQNQLRSISERLGNEGNGDRPVVERYVDLLRRAESAASQAAIRASSAAQKARELSVEAAQQAQQGGRGLYQRLLRRMGRGGANNN